MGTYAGRLLVAQPWLGDPNFHRTVVLLLDHSDDGAFGVVLNRPTSVAVEAVLPGWQWVTSEPGQLHQGGPVGLDGAIGLVLLRTGDAAPEAVDHLTGPYGLVDLDSDPDELVGRLAGLRVFAGHSGWSGGQLEEEIEAGGWWVLPARPTDVVTSEPEQLWRHVLRRQGGVLAIASTYAEDPALN